MTAQQGSDFDPVGTWTLKSWTREVVDTGEVSHIFGTAPKGIITYGTDGRVTALIVAEMRKKPENMESMTDAERALLFRTVVAYSGTYRLNGQTLIHHVDISWNEVWTGTDQVREFVFDGKQLSLKTPPLPSPVDGKIAVATLVWERAT
jgi:hypothetical protein